MAKIIIKFVFLSFHSSNDFDGTWFDKMSNTKVENAVYFVWKYKQACVYCNVGNLDGITVNLIIFVLQTQLHGDSS